MLLDVKCQDAGDLIFGATAIFGGIPGSSMGNVYQNGMLPSLIPRRFNWLASRAALHDSRLLFSVRFPSRWLLS